MSTATPAELGLTAEPLTADPGDPPSTHVRVKLDAQLRALLAHEPGTRVGTDPEQLHQMRVAVRRARSVLKHSGVLLGDDADGLRAELRWLGDALGEVRDYDVLIAHLRHTVTDFDERDQAAARTLISEFVSARGHAKRRLTRKFGTARYSKLLGDIAGLVRQADTQHDDASPETHEDQVSLVGTLRKPRKKLSKALAALPEDPDDDDLHALRIRGKRLRYAAELARSAAGKKTAKRLKALIKAAKRLQDTLGEHQDAVVAAERMRELASDSAGSEVGFVAGRIAERELARRARARERWPREAAELEKAARAVL